MLLAFLAVSELSGFSGFPVLFEGFSVLVALLVVKIV